MLALLYHKYGKLKEITHNVGVRLYENYNSTVLGIQEGVCVCVCALGGGGGGGGWMGQEFCWAVRKVSSHSLYEKHDELQHQAREKNPWLRFPRSY